MPAMIRCRLIVLAPLVLALAACSSESGSSTTPTSPSAAQVTGSWTGSLDSTNFAQQGMTLTLTQSGTSVTGTWTATPLPFSGAVSGAMSGDTFTGSLTLSTPGATGGTCAGTAAFTGSVSATTLTWTSQSGFTGPCGGMPVGVRIVAQRRPA